jgi:O-antigen/teichoic acid export membrane protein
MITASNILLLPILTKSLSALDYGIWSQVWISIPLITTIVTLGLPMSMSRFFPTRSKEEYSKDFTSILSVVVVFMILVVAMIFSFRTLIATALFEGNVNVVLLLIAIIILWTIDFTYLELLRSLRSMKRYGTLLFGQNVAEIGLAVTFVLLGKGVEGAILALLLVRSILLFIVLCASKRLISYRAPTLSRLRPYVIYGLPTIPMFIATWMLSSVDRYMIAILKTTADVGLYAPAYLVGQSVPLLMASVLSFSLLPSLSPMYEHDKIEQIRSSLSFMLKLFLFISLPFVGGTLFLSSPVLQIISTQKVAMNASHVVPVVAAGLVFFGLKVIFSQPFYMEKKTIRLSITYVFSAMINLVLNAFLIPFIGIMGAAIATLISYAADFTLTTMMGNASLYPKILLSHVSSIVITTIVVTLVAGATKHFMPLYPSFFGLIFGIVSFFLCFYYISPLDEDEKSMIGEILSSIKQ